MKVPSPSKVGEATRPTAQGEKPEPEKYTAFDPVSKAAEDTSAFLQQRHD